jgi:hypothetical protein
MIVHATSRQGDQENRSLRPAQSKKLRRPFISTIKKTLGIVVHACHSSYEERTERSPSRLAQAKNNQSKKVWAYGSSSREPV